MDIIRKFSNDSAELEVRILGDSERPLFVARDVAKVLDIKDINSTIRDFDDEQKGMHIVHTPGGDQTINVLTEEGLYKLLFVSRKDAAKRFQKWVFNVIHELRTKGKYELEQKFIEEKKQIESKTQELETKYNQLDSFMKRKHFTARDVIYLAQMHPSRKDDLYKFGRTTDETSRRKNYRGQRAEPIEMVDTLPVIDRKRAESNLKYIVEPYIYSNTSEEIVQMPYHLLKLAADAAVYIDKIKLKISEEMKNYIPPHIQDTTIEPASNDDIAIMEAEVGDISLTISDDHKCEGQIPEEMPLGDVSDHDSDDNILDESDADDDKYDLFVRENIRQKDGAKLTRVKLQERIKAHFGNENLTPNTYEIIKRLAHDKKATTIIGYELTDSTIADFINAYCDTNPSYRIDTVTLMEAYLRNTPNAIKQTAKFLQTLQEMGYNNTRNTDGRFVIGLALKDGSLESFIRDKCAQDDGFKVSFDDFNNAYTTYCTEKSLRAYKRPTIKARMSDLGYGIQKYNNGCINFMGITVAY